MSLSSVVWDVGCDGDIFLTLINFHCVNTLTLDFITRIIGFRVATLISLGNIRLRCFFLGGAYRGRRFPRLFRWVFCIFNGRYFDVRVLLSSVIGEYRSPQGFVNQPYAPHRLKASRERLWPTRGNITRKRRTKQE